MLPLDVNSWLVTFGFHLHNAIPGFPVPKFDLTEPSYELVKSQQWEDVPVRNKKQNYEKVIDGLSALTSPFNQATLVKTAPKTLFDFFFFLTLLGKKNITSLHISVQQTRGLLNRLKSVLSDANKNIKRHYPKVIK